MPKPTLVEIHYLSGCENVPPTLRLIERVAQKLGIPIELREVKLDSQADFVNLRFHGSPSVLINGQDIDSAARNCTVYGPG
jgi:hypothetical protein